MRRLRLIRPQPVLVSRSSPVDASNTTISHRSKTDRALIFLNWVDFMTNTLRVALLCSAACVLPVTTLAGDVKAFPANGVNLSTFKTYKMLSTRVLTKRGVLENDPDISPIVNAAIRSELNAKGLKEVSEGGDLQVSAGALVEVSAQLEAIIYNINMDATWGTSPLVTIGRYNKEGTLIVNLIDPRVTKSVWIGFARRALGRPSNRESEINKAAHALFKKYPSVH